MRKNRKTTKRASSIAANTARLAVPLATAAGMVMFYMTASVKCNALAKSVDASEKELVKATADRERAQAKWDAVRSSGNLDRALMKWGLAMNLPSPAQIVRMDENGRPHPGQMSVALAQQRAAASQSARAAR